MNETGDQMAEEANQAIRDDLAMKAMHYAEQTVLRMHPKALAQNAKAFLTEYKRRYKKEMSAEEITECDKLAAEFGAAALRRSKK